MTSWVSMCEDEDDDFRALNEATEVREWSAAEELAELRGVPFVRRSWYDPGYYTTGTLMTIPEETEQELEDYNNYGLTTEHTHDNTTLNTEDTHDDTGLNTQEEEGWTTDEDQAYDLLEDDDEASEERVPLLEEEESDFVEEEEEEEVEAEKLHKTRSLFSRIGSALKRVFFPCLKR